MATFTNFLKQLLSFICLKKALVHIHNKEIENEWNSKSLKICLTTFEQYMQTNFGYHIHLEKLP